MDRANRALTWVVVAGWEGAADWEADWVVAETAAEG